MREKYWLVPCSHSHNNVILMSQNEKSNEWSRKSDSLMLAIRLQIMNLPITAEDSNKIIASIVFNFDTTGKCNDSIKGYCHSGILDTFNILWGWFNNKYIDTCFISPLYFIPRNYQSGEKSGGVEFSNEPAICNIFACRHRYNG